MTPLDERGLMPMSDLPTEIEYRIWQIYFSEYVLKNIPYARLAYDDTILRGWLPKTGKFAWAHDTGNWTNYQEVEEWTDKKEYLVFGGKEGRVRLMKRPTHQPGIVPLVLTKLP